MLSNQLDSNPPLCVYFVIQQAESALAARENSAHPLSIAAMSDADALRIRAVAAFYLQQETLAQVALCASIAYCRAYQGFSGRLVSVDSLLFLVPDLLQCFQAILFDSLLSKVSRCSD